MAKHQKEGLDTSSVARDFFQTWQRQGAAAASPFFDSRAAESEKTLPLKLEHDSLFRIKEVAGVDKPTGERETVNRATGERVQLQEVTVHLVKSERAMEGDSPVSILVLIATDSKKVFALDSMRTDSESQRGAPTVAAELKFPSKADPLGLTQHLTSQIAYLLKGGRSETNLPWLLGMIKGSGEEFRAGQPLRIHGVMNGTATIRERRLPAAIVDAELLTVNKAEAEYKSHRFYYAAAQDAEFDVWRAVLATCCGDNEHDLAQWKEQVSFEQAK